MNILTNAIDAIEESNQEQTHEQLQHRSNTIWISTETIDDHFIKVTIADNGSGIAENIRSRLFDPFFTTKPVGSGTGLGLSISYQIVTEKHNGKLCCDSTPSQGTKFCNQRLRRKRTEYEQPLFLALLTPQGAGNLPLMRIEIPLKQLKAA